MTRSQRAHRNRIRRRRVAAGLVALVALVAVLGDQMPASSTPTAASPLDVPREAPRKRDRAVPTGGDHDGEADGAVPDGTTVFDDAIPGVANLDADLLDALRRAASENGVRLIVNSGWRSPEYQARLLDEAVAQYGSREEAARWAATPNTSAHVSGDAVDVGPADAAAWLSAHGAAYGLCQIYGNEPWHFELRPEAIESGCPPMYADPTQDPRMNG